MDSLQRFVSDEQRAGTAPILPMVVAVLVITGTAACSSISKSVESSSKIVSSPITSLSASSSPGDQYRADVRDFTAAFLKSGGDASQLKSEIAEVAEKHGVTDWERDESTYTGLGEGLRKAGESQAGLDAFKRTLAGNDEQAKWMQEGYDDYEPED